MNSITKASNNLASYWRRSKSRRRRSAMLCNPVAAEILECRRLLTPLTSGERAVGTIQQGGVGTYTINADAGDTLVIAVGRSSGSNVRMVMDVAAPGGVSGGGLGESSFFNESRREIPVPVTGTYTISISADRETDSFGYRIRPFVISSAGETTGSVDRQLSNGAEFSGSLENGSFEIAQFQARAGNRIVMGISSDPNSLVAAQFRIYPPWTGRTFVGGGSSGSSIGLVHGGTTDFEAPVTGTYTVIIREMVDQSVEYQGRLAVLPSVNGQAVQLIPENDATISAGGSVQRSISHGSFGLVLFDVQPGQRAEFTGSGEIRGVFAPSGASVSGSGGQYTTTELGTHIAFIRNVAAQEFTFDRSMAISNPITPVVHTRNALIRSRISRPTIAWTPSQTANRYQVQINSLTTGETAVVDEFTELTQFETPSELPIGEYEVLVRRNNSNGGLSAWSTPAKLIVDVSPVLSAEVIGGVTTISWNQLAGSAMYDVWVNSRTTGQSQVVRKLVSGDTDQLQESLPYGDYAVWVRAKDVNDRAASWSRTVHFSKVPVVPDPDGNATSTFDRTPQISWASTDEGVTYEIFFRDASGAIHRQSGLASPNWTPDADLPIGKSYWWVRSTGDGVSGEWSPRQELTIGGQPEILTVSGTYDISEFVLSWLTVDGATSYNVYALHERSRRVTQEVVSSGTTWSPETDLLKGSYRIWIQAVSNGTEGFWSIAGNFVWNG